MENCVEWLCAGQTGANCTLMIWKVLAAAEAPSGGLLGPLCKHSQQTEPYMQITFFLDFGINLEATEAPEESEPTWPLWFVLSDAKRKRQTRQISIVQVLRPNQVKKPLRSASVGF